MRNPDRPERVQTWNRTFQSAHSLWIDQERGLLFANGADGRTGGVRVLDLRANPADPTEVGSFNGFYVHDSYTRGTTLYAAAINDGFLGILDASNPANIVEITRFATGGRVHAQRLADAATAATSSRPTSAWTVRSRAGTC